MNNKELTTHDIVEIPIVWHILYTNEDENIPLTQLESQIERLNEDYNLLNEDSDYTPDEWKDLRGNYSIRFYTINVIRKQTPETQFDYDKMKFDKSSGSDVVEPNFNLNIWTINLLDDEEINGGGVLGYAQFPGKFNESPETDGVVLDYRVTGKTHYTGYDLGRTATHEIGHWLNLRHIWGDGDCLVDDKISDTPLASGPHSGCGVYPTTSSCGTPDMFMNYMDYSDDVCMVMFTHDQVLRSRALFAKGGIRRSFVTHKYTTSRGYSHAKLRAIGALAIVIMLAILVSLIYMIYRIYKRCRRSIPEAQLDIEMGEDVET